MSKPKPKPDTPYKGSWAEDMNKPRPIPADSWIYDKQPGIVHPLIRNAVRIGPIDPKLTRIFNG